MNYIKELEIALEGSEPYGSGLIHPNIVLSIQARSEEFIPKDAIYRILQSVIGINDRGEFRVSDLWIQDDDIRLWVLREAKSFIDRKRT